LIDELKLGNTQSFGDTMTTQVSSLTLPTTTTARSTRIIKKTESAIWQKSAAVGEVGDDNDDDHGSSSSWGNIVTSGTGKRSMKTAADRGEFAFVEFSNDEDDVSEESESVECTESTVEHIVFAEPVAEPDTMCGNNSVVAAKAAELGAGANDAGRNGSDTERDDIEPIKLSDFPVPAVDKYSSMLPTGNDKAVTDANVVTDSEDGETTDEERVDDSVTALDEDGLSDDVTVSSVDANERHDLSFSDAVSDFDVGCTTNDDVLSMEPSAVEYIDSENESCRGDGMVTAAETVRSRSVKETLDSADMQDEMNDENKLTGNTCKVEASGEETDSGKTENFDESGGKHFTVVSEQKPENDEMPASSELQFEQESGFGKSSDADIAASRRITLTTNRVVEVLKVETSMLIIPMSKPDDAAGAGSTSGDVANPNGVAREKEVPAVAVDDLMTMDGSLQMDGANQSCHGDPDNICITGPLSDVVDDIDNRKDRGGDVRSTKDARVIYHNHPKDETSQADDDSENGDDGKSDASDAVKDNDYVTADLIIREFLATSEESAGIGTVLDRTVEDAVQRSSMNSGGNSESDQETTALRSQNVMTCTGESLHENVPAAGLTASSVDSVIAVSTMREENETELIRFTSGMDREDSFGVFNDADSIGVGNLGTVGNRTDLGQSFDVVAQRHAERDNVAQDADDEDFLTATSAVDEGDVTAEHSLSPRKYVTTVDERIEYYRVDSGSEPSGSLSDYVDSECEIANSGNRTDSGETTLETSKVDEMITAMEMPFPSNTMVLSTNSCEVDETVDINEAVMTTHSDDENEQTDNPTGESDNLTVHLSRGFAVTADEVGDTNERVAFEMSAKVDRGPTAEFLQTVNSHVTVDDAERPCTCNNNSMNDDNLTSLESVTVLTDEKHEPIESIGDRGRNDDFRTVTTTDWLDQEVYLPSTAILTTPDDVSTRGIPTYYVQESTAFPSDIDFLDDAFRAAADDELNVKCSTADSVKGIEAVETNDTRTIAANVGNETEADYWRESRTHVTCVGDMLTGQSHDSGGKCSRVGEYEVVDPNDYALVECRTMNVIETESDLEQMRAISNELVTSILISANLQASLSVESYENGGVPVALGTCDSLFAAAAGNFNVNNDMTSPSMALLRQVADAAPLGDRRHQAADVTIVDDVLEVSCDETSTLDNSAACCGDELNDTDDLLNSARLFVQFGNEIFGSDELLYGERPMPDDGDAAAGYSTSTTAYVTAVALPLSGATEDLIEMHRNAAAAGATAMEAAGSGCCGDTVDAGTRKLVAPNFGIRQMEVACGPLLSASFGNRNGELDVEMAAFLSRVNDRSHVGKPCSDFDTLTPSDRRSVSDVSSNIYVGAMEIDSMADLSKRTNACPADVSIIDDVLEVSNEVVASEQRRKTYESDVVVCQQTATNDDVYELESAVPQRSGARNMIPAGKIVVPFSSGASQDAAAERGPEVLGAVMPSDVIRSSPSLTSSVDFRLHAGGKTTPVGIDLPHQVAADSRCGKLKPIDSSGSCSMSPSRIATTSGGGGVEVDAAARTNASACPTPGTFSADVASRNRMSYGDRLPMAQPFECFDVGRSSAATDKKQPLRVGISTTRQQRTPPPLIPKSPPLLAAVSSRSQQPRQLLPSVTAHGSGVWVQDASRESECRPSSSSKVSADASEWSLMSTALIGLDDGCCRRSLEDGSADDVGHFDNHRNENEEGHDRVLKEQVNGCKCMRNSGYNVFLQNAFM
jgi:hypothetical protein